ncbi:MAG: GerMN domain-containing protein [Lachnospiraceae bacterium]|nr:GerMN domain-containing protein [Lachnospiraceae bacterium]
MKKRLLLFSTLVIMMFSFAGCGGQTLTEYEQQNESSHTAATEKDATTDTLTAQPEEEMQKTESVSIFYSNAQATGFEKTEVSLEQLTPDNLLAELAKVNVVSYDTKALNFSKSGKSLTLDLSADFSNYINMMGTAGEYIVLGSLVNTFLTAYDADDILITIKGNTLETSHAIYDKALTMYETSDSAFQGEEEGKKEPMVYRLKDTAYTQDDIKIYYPQFDGMPDEELQKEWNQAIFEIVSVDSEKDEKEYESYDVDYKVGLCTTEIISFLFTEKTKISDEINTRTYALTFDLVEGKSLRFGEMTDMMETVSYNMANGGYFKVTNADVDREAFDEYYKQKIKDSGDFREMFLRYDYDLTDLSFEPQGYSYINGDGELEIIMNPVPELSKEQLIIQTGIKIK